MHEKTKDPTKEPVVVFTSWRDDEIALAESMLRSTDISFYVANEHIVNIVGDGRLGGTNQVTGPLQILVAASDAADAFEVLDSLCSTLETGAKFNAPQTLRWIERIFALFIFSRSYFRLVYYSSYWSTQFLAM